MLTNFDFKEYFSKKSNILEIKKNRRKTCWKNISIIKNIKLILKQR